MPATIDAPVDTPSDADIARMPDVAAATLADTFHWPMTDEERLYRDCPSAFWLAPDAERSMPPTDGPLPAAAPADATPEEDIHRATAEGLGPAMAMGVAIAGPVFVATMSLVSPGSGTPLARIVTGIGLAIASTPLTVPFGGLAAAIPVFVGVSLLSWLGNERPAARRRRWWAATGAGMGLVIAAAFDAGLVSIPLVLTSIACATIAHRALHWVEPEFA